MAVPTTVLAIRYTGNGSTSTPYTIPFPFFDVAHIYIAISSDGVVEPVIQEAAAYAVTRNADGQGGSLVTAAAVTSPATITIFRQLPITQPTAFQAHGSFPAKSSEFALDRNVMMVQQLASRVATLEGVTDEGYIFVPGAGMSSADTLSWVDTAARGAVVPARVGQFGVQLDTQTVWISQSTTAGDWVEFNPVRTEQLVVGLVSDAGTPGANQTAAADLLAQWEPDAVIFAGDNNNSGSAAYDSDWAAFADYVTAGTAYPALGNEELDVTGWQARLDAKFDYLPGNRRYYRAQLGDGLLDIFVLSSGRDSAFDLIEPDGNLVGSVQHEWFVDELAASRARWRIAVFHHPPASLSPAANATEPQMQWPELARMDLVCCGHTHLLEILKWNDTQLVNLSSSVTADGTALGTITDGEVTDAELWSDPLSNGIGRLVISQERLTIEVWNIDGTLLHVRDVRDLGLPVPVVSLSPAELGTARVVYLAIRGDGKEGDGTEENPYCANTSSDLDRRMRWLAADASCLDEDGDTLPLVARFGPGRFLTKGEHHWAAWPILTDPWAGQPHYPNVDGSIGWLVHNDWIIEGAGEGVTIFAQDGWPQAYLTTPASGGILQNWPYAHCVISGATGNAGYISERAKIRNCTIDCNARNISDRPLSMKLDAARLYGDDTAIENVTAIDGYGLNFYNTAVTSFAVGTPGTVTATAHGLGNNDFVTFAKAVTAVSAANPAVVTSTGHARVTGETVTLSGLNETAAITSASAANPSVVTCPAHGRTTGDVVTLSGIAGSTATPALNGTHAIIVLTSSTFSLTGVNCTVAGTGGTMTSAATAINGARVVTVVDANSFSIPVNAVNPCPATQAGFLATPNYLVAKVNDNVFTLKTLSGLPHALTHAGTGGTLYAGGGEGFTVGVYEPVALGVSGGPALTGPSTGTGTRNCTVRNPNSDADYLVGIVGFVGNEGNIDISGNCIRDYATGTCAVQVQGNGCSIKNNKAFDCFAFLHLDSVGVSNLQVSGNVALRCGGPAVSITPGFAGADYDNFSFSGNVWEIESAATPPWAMVLAPAGNGTLTNMRVYNDTFLQTGAGNGTQIAITGALFSGLTILGCWAHSSLYSQFTSMTNLMVRDCHTQTGAEPLGLEDTRVAAAMMLAADLVTGTGGVAAKILFDTVAYDYSRTSTLCNTADSKFVIPKTGAYRFGVCAFTSSSTWTWQVYINAAVHTTLANAVVQGGGPLGFSAMASSDTWLSAGDELEFYAMASASAQVIAATATPAAACFIAKV